MRHVLAQADSGTVWTPGLALLLVETGATDEAAHALEPVRSTGFDLPVDAMWSTVMVMMIETMVQLDDTEACAVLRDRFERLAGSNVHDGLRPVVLRSGRPVPGMLSLTLGDLDAAEEQLGLALEADSAGGSVLWSNESRLWLAPHPTGAGPRGRGRCDGGGGGAAGCGGRSAHASSGWPQRVEG